MEYKLYSVNGPSTLGKLNNEEKSYYKIDINTFLCGIIKQEVLL